MAHDNLKPLLSGKPGGLFVSNLTRSIYKWADKVPARYFSYRVLEEYTIRYDTDERTRLDLDFKRHYIIDAVLFVKPGFRSLNQGQTYTVGLEIKGSIADLKSDEKIENYIGWVDYFFIAVDGNKPGLVEVAIQRAEDNSLIGVMDIATGQIHKIPERAQVPTDHYVKLLQNALYHYLFDDSKTIIVSPDVFEYESGGGQTPKPQGEPTVSQTERVQRTYRREDAEVYRKTQSDVIQTALETVDPTAQKVYEAISNGYKKTVKIAEEVGISPSAVANATASLKKAGLINRKGGCRNATYETSSPEHISIYKGKCLKCELYKDLMNREDRCKDCNP